VSHLTKTETSLVIRLNIVAIVAQSVCLLPAYMSKDVHATRQLHCQWLYMVSAMPNMQNTLRIDEVIAISLVYYFYGDTV